MLELAKRTGARILQSSTSEVYGDPAVHQQPETYWGNVDPIGLRSCYDEGKRVAETLMVDYHRQYRVPIRIARIFNTYGPHMAVSDGRVISSFIVQALEGVPLTVFGDGSQTRSFCYVSDLIRGLRALMENDGTKGPVNLGNSEEFTIERLAHEVLRLTKSTCPIVHRRLPADDPCRRRPDITLASKALGWVPRVPLSEGLRHTVAYFTEVLNAAGDLARERDLAVVRKNGPARVLTEEFGRSHAVPSKRVCDGMCGTSVELSDRGSIVE